MAPCWLQLHGSLTSVWAAAGGVGSVVIVCARVVATLLWGAGECLVGLF